MRNTFAILCFILCSTHELFAQITITNDIFPVEGDTLSTIIDNGVENLDLQSAGADQYWDFSLLEAAFMQNLEFKNAEEATYFEQYPTAELFTTTVNGDEVYYKSNSSTMLEIGRSTENPFGDAFEVFIEFEEAALYRRAPFSYGDDFESDSKSTITFAGSELPDSLVANLPIVPDSIRISIEETRFDTIDAWGTLLLPGGEFEVLRERTHIVRFTSISALTFIGWIEIDPATLGGLGAFFGESDIYRYNFYTDQFKEIAATVNLDEDGLATSVEYASLGIVLSSGVVLPDQKEVISYPNPSYGEVKFQFINMGKGPFRIDIRNIIGKSLHSETHNLEKEQLVKMNLAHLQKGTYIYSIYDDKGQKLMTKRIVLMNP